MKILVALSLFFLLGLTACNAKPSSPTNSPVSQQTGSISVQSIEILKTVSQPVQINALVKGNLPDNCTTLDQAIAQREGSNFTITLSTSRQTGATCTNQPIAFERVIPLDTTGIHPGSYTVMAEGVSVNFDMGAVSTAEMIVPVTGLSTSSPTPMPGGELPTAQATPTEIPTVPTESPAVPTESPLVPSPVPTSTTAPTTEVSQEGSGCINKAAFYGDVTIPDNTIFEQGVEFTKTWQIRNEGTCVWGPDYALIFTGGYIMDGPLTSRLPEVQPDELVNISVKLKSPAAPATYTGLWEFQDPNGSRFGVNSNGKDLIWVKIAVKMAQTAGTSSSNIDCGVTENTDYENTILNLINQARADHGLTALVSQSHLSKAAFLHSSDMACNDFVDHTGSDGSSWKDRISGQGYTYRYASENIYVGNPSFGGTPEGAFEWWMNSQVHRDNILSTKITEIGIGYAFFANSTYGGYYTLDFAHP